MLNREKSQKNQVANFLNSYEFNNLFVLVKSNYVFFGYSSEVRYLAFE
jgi:hypothetical protein